MQVDLLSEADDATLVGAIAERHEPALEEVYRRHAPAIAGLARRLLGEGALAEDLTQEIFLRLWRQPERFDANRGKLRTLLLTQAHGHAVDLIRQQTARARREERVEREPRQPPPDLDAELIALTEYEQVRLALEALPTDERLAIELAFYGGHTYRQVATILDVPEGTIKSRIRSGLRRLHQLLTVARESEPANPDRSDPQKDQPWNS